MADGDTLWVWQYRDVAGRWMIIPALSPAGVRAPLVLDDANAAAIAADSAKRYGQQRRRPVRLAKFRLEESQGDEDG